MTVQLFNGDCLEFMRTLPAGSVDAVVTDPPYGVLDYEWDVVDALPAWWDEVKRILKPTGTAVVFSAQPFTADLIVSNLSWFKQEIIWHKPRASGFIHAKNALMKAHENIVVFSGGVINHEGKTDKRMTYNPQMSQGKPYTKKNIDAQKLKWNNQKRPSTCDYVSLNDGTRYPRSVVEFDNHNGGNEHPTQKPVDLMEWLVKTYANEGETVVDCFMGSGTTGVACVQTGRHFIGCEIDAGYFEIAKKRIADAQMQPALDIGTMNK